jgi:hypothetical protein
VLFCIVPVFAATPPEQRLNIEFREEEVAISAAVETLRCRRGEDSLASTVEKLGESPAHDKVRQD